MGGHLNPHIAFVVALSGFCYFVWFRFFRLPFRNRSSFRFQIVMFLVGFVFSNGLSEMVFLIVGYWEVPGSYREVPGGSIGILNCITSTCIARGSTLIAPGRNYLRCTWLYLYLKYLGSS